MRFSERMGYRAARDAIQLEEIDWRTRRRLANLLSLRVFQALHERSAGRGRVNPRFSASSGDMFLYRLYDELLHVSVPQGQVPISEIEGAVQKRVKEGAWHDVFDVVEFILGEFFCEESDAELRERNGFVEEVNGILEAECCAYRVLRDRVVPLTTDSELRAIDQALEDAPSPGTAIHLERALELLTDREAPDYRNSIKESISAVESACSTITGESSSTLGRALKVLDASGQPAIHPALNAAFSKLYGYTCDSDGIRHALIDETELSHEDAQFMLVTCSAFVNYLRAKQSKMTE